MPGTLRCIHLGEIFLHPLGKASSNTDFKVFFVNFFLKDVKVRKTRMVKRGSIVLTARPIKAMLLRISSVSDCQRRIMDIRYRIVEATKRTLFDGWNGFHDRLLLCPLGFLTSVLALGVRELFRLVRHNGNRL